MLVLTLILALKRLLMLVLVLTRILVLVLVPMFHTHKDTDAMPCCTILILYLSILDHTIRDYTIPHYTMR